MFNKKLIYLEKQLVGRRLLDDLGRTLDCGKKLRNSQSNLGNDYKDVHYLRKIKKSTFRSCVLLFDCRRICNLLRSTYFLCGSMWCSKKLKFAWVAMRRRLNDDGDPLVCNYKAANGKGLSCTLQQYVFFFSFGASIGEEIFILNLVVESCVAPSLRRFCRYPGEGKSSTCRPLRRRRGGSSLRLIGGGNNLKYEIIIYKAAYSKLKSEHVNFEREGCILVFIGTRN